MAEMTQKAMAAMGGRAKAAGMSAEQKAEMGKRMAHARWGDAKRAKRLRARKAGRIASASRKANRGTE
jgi:hypothetical protein